MLSRAKISVAFAQRKILKSEHKNSLDLGSWTKRKLIWDTNANQWKRTFATWKQKMEQSNKNRGAFIVFEGVDRSGKSTQSQKLVEKLTAKSIPVQTMRFPGIRVSICLILDRTTPIGQVINSFLTNKDTKLNDQSIHLLFSVNRWEAR
jgi:hypothetical protein